MQVIGELRLLRPTSGPNGVRARLRLIRDYEETRASKSALCPRQLPAVSRSVTC